MMEYRALQPLALPWDERRGSMGMALFIATEAFLFVALFFAYFYLGHYAPQWPPDPPKLALALVMLAVLLSSSAVLYAGEHAVQRGRPGAARAAIAVTLLLGAAFLGVQAYEYADRLRTLRPTTDAYGSIFYTITSIHALHVLLGLCMLAYVAVLPALRPMRPPYRPLHNASLYWHFVDAVWVVIVALLYLLPRLGT
jgi:heme/copper-type cytochrome/quinol oxidase subunit 3